MQILLQIRFYLFLIFSQKPKTRIKFPASWWSRNAKYFCFLFIASRALLQRHVEINRLLHKDFLHVIPPRIFWNLAPKFY